MLHTKHKIEFDAEKCIGCKLCYKACFIDIIRWDEEKKQPIFKYVSECAHCNYCMASCKKGAITVVCDYASQNYRQSFDIYR